MPTHVCPSSSKLTMPTTTSTCFVPVPAWTNKNTFISASGRAWLLLLNKTRAVCSKKGGWQHLQRTYLEKKQQFCCAKRKKRCVNFISRLKSWVNYVRLSSNSAKQLFVYLGPPWVSGPYACLVCKPGHTGQDPASLTETRDCVCGSVCACVVCVCVHLLQLKRLVWQITSDPTPLGDNVCVCVCVDCSSYTLQM